MTSASYPSAYDPSHFVGNTMSMKNMGDTSTMGGRKHKMSRKTRRHKKSAKKSRKGGKKSRKSRR